MRFTAKTHGCLYKKFHAGLHSRADVRTDGRTDGRMVTLLPKFNASFLTHDAPLHAKAQHRNKSVNTGKTDKCSLRTWDYLPPSLPERLT